MPRGSVRLREDVQGRAGKAYCLRNSRVLVTLASLQRMHVFFSARNQLLTLLWLVTERGHQTFEQLARKHHELQSKGQ